MRVLLVEDNIEFSRLVAKQLERAGFDCDLASTIEIAEQAVANVNYAAVVLDLGLPDQDGLTMLRTLRSRDDAVPVLITTARNGLQDRVEGLREGADDYLVKPFSLDELIARLHALMRRPGKLLRNVMIAGNITLDGKHHQVNVGDQALRMRLRETVLLDLLMRHVNQVVPRRYIQDQLFGLNGEQDANTIDVYVHRLRRQLLDARATASVHAIRGVGYMLTEDKDPRGNATAPKIADVSSVESAGRDLRGAHHNGR
jgi:DNA-binding response OmpR family regulator